MLASFVCGTASRFELPDLSEQGEELLKEQHRLWHLKMIRWFTGSQWRERRPGVMWDLQAENHNSQCGNWWRHGPAFLHHICILIWQRSSDGRMRFDRLSPAWHPGLWGEGWGDHWYWCGWYCPFSFKELLLTQWWMSSRHLLGLCKVFVRGGLQEEVCVVCIRVKVDVVAPQYFYQIYSPEAT